MTREVLNSDGFLPEGRHRVTADEFRQVFVEDFPHSKTRARLYLRWERHRQALASVIPIEAQWINGSFVTDKDDPNDVDVVTLLDGPTFDSLAVALQDMAGALLAGKATKGIWGIDSYAVLRYPDGHTGRAAEEAALAEWDALWSTVKDDSGRVKGYLEVRP